MTQTPQSPGTELLPVEQIDACPFCGPRVAVNVKSSSQFRHWVQCYGGCRGPICSSEAEAIAAWSTRAATPQPAQAVGDVVPHSKYAEANNGCWAKALDDEPMFIILGRDPDAGNIVRLWAQRRIAAGDVEHGNAVLPLADAMDGWRVRGYRPSSAPSAESYPALTQTGESALREALEDLSDKVDRFNGVFSARERVVGRYQGEMQLSLMRARRALAATQPPVVGESELWRFTRSEPFPDETAPVENKADRSAINNMLADLRFGYRKQQTLGDVLCDGVIPDPNDDSAAEVYAARITLTDAILAALIPDPKRGEDQTKTIEILRRALAWHGDRTRMATTREEWQHEIDAAIEWVKANPEADRPSFSSFRDINQEIIERCAKVAEARAIRSAGARGGIGQIFADTQDQEAREIAAAIRKLAGEA